MTGETIYLEMYVCRYMEYQKGIDWKIDKHNNCHLFSLNNIVCLGFIQWFDLQYEYNRWGVRTSSQTVPDLLKV